MRIPFQVFLACMAVLCALNAGVCNEMYASGKWSIRKLGIFYYLMVLTFLGVLIWTLVALK